jgi:hypothetical protein
MLARVLNSSKTQRKRAQPNAYTRARPQTSHKTAQYRPKIAQNRPKPQLREYEAAAERLLTARSAFEALQAAGRARTRIEPNRLEAHVDFCARTHALVGGAPALAWLGVRCFGWVGLGPIWEGSPLKPFVSVGRC